MLFILKYHFEGIFEKGKYYVFLGNLSFEGILEKVKYYVFLGNIMSS